MLLHGFLDRIADRVPEKEAIVTEEKRVTYSEFRKDAYGLARSLVKGGVRRGDRVLVWLENRYETAVAIYGVLLAGAAFIPLNPTSKARRADFVVKDSEPAAAIVSGRRRNWLETVARLGTSLRWAALVEAEPQSDSCGSISVRSFETAVREVPTAALPRVIDQDLAAIIYTSGTTSDPKGIVCPHANMAAAATSIIAYLENVEDDIVLDALPLSFDYGLYQLLMVVQFGGKLILERSFAFHYAIAERIGRERVTGLPGVPTLFTMLLYLDLSGVDLSSIRYLTNTGAAVSPPLIARVRQAFPRARFYSMFGLSECKRVSYLPPEELDRRPESVGKAMPNCETYLVDDDGSRITTPGKIGELVIRGSNVMRGYWNRPKETAGTYRPGPTPEEHAVYSGDLFREDEEGFLYFVGRKDEVFKSRGEKVSPREVESVIEEIPGVAECGAVGLPDEVLGNRTIALVVPRKGAAISEKDVLKYAAEHLDANMIPARVLLCDALPRSPNGKLVRQSLLEIAHSLIEKEGSH
jgi:amino acid adenylation domain-containing protein